MSGPMTTETSSPQPSAKIDGTQEDAPPALLSPAASRRLLQGFGATALYPIVTAIVQILTVPIFLRFWGPSLYGEWLLLITVPQYMALSDMGFGSVAGNDMTMRVAANDRNGALCSFQSAWVMICLISTVFGTLAVVAVYLLPLRRWLHLATMQPGEFHGVLLLLIIYSMVTLQSTLTASGFRCDGNYALGTVLLNVLRLVEALGTVAIVIFGAVPLLVAAFMVATRLAGQVALCLILRRRSPWITWGVDHASKSAVLQMAHPATAFMAFPLGQAMSIQGMLIVIGVALGPTSVAVFSTLRTLSRIGSMLVETVRHSIWPELSATFGAKNWAYARKLHGKGCQAGVLLGGGASLVLALFGRRLYIFWTHGMLSYNPTLFDVLLFVIVVNSLWNTSSVVSLACNAHQRIAGVYLAGTLLSLPVSYLLIPHFGLLGPALTLVAVEFVIAPYVLKISLSILHETPSDFLRELFTPPDLRGLMAQIRG
jgi:O-antigen/teichoic acid export membrane protein